MTTTILIMDTSVLINFLVLDRVELLSQLTSFSFVVTEHVRAEITDHFPEQLQRLNTSMSRGTITEIAVTDILELKLFAKLTASGLGEGECSAFAVAVNRNLKIAIDDKRAVKKLAQLGFQIEAMGTEQIVVLLINESILTVEDADQMKFDWGNNHRFKLPFLSFNERTQLR